MSTVIKGDTFQGINLLLTAHAPTGPNPATSWIKPAASPGDLWINPNLGGGVVADLVTLTAQSLAYISDVPQSTEYDVSCYIDAASLVANFSGVTLGMSASGVDFYYAIVVSDGRIILGGNGAASGLSITYNGYTPTVGDYKPLTIRRALGQLSVIFDGATVIGPVVDASIPAVGFAGLLSQRFYSPGSPLTSDVQLITPFVATFYDAPAVAAYIGASSASRSSIGRSSSSGARRFRSTHTFERSSGLWIPTRR